MSASASDTSDTSWSREPRSTGEIVTDAVTILRRSFGTIVSVAVPFCAVDLVMRELGTSLLLSFNTLAATPEALTPEVMLDMLPRVLAGMGFIALSFVTQQLLMGAITSLGAQAWHGETPKASVALSRLAKRGPMLLLTSLLFMALVVLISGGLVAIPMAAGAFVAITTGSFIVMVVGTVVGVFASFGSLLILTLRWALYGAVVVVEDVSLHRALFRSSALTAPRGLPFAETPRFRLSVLFVIALALSGVLQSLFIVPRLVVAALTGWTFSNGALPGLAQLPLWFAVPFSLIEVVTNAAVIPLSGLLLALFMLDLRLRYDEPAT